jgi:hypothetical protein
MGKRFLEMVQDSSAGDWKKQNGQRGSRVKDLNLILSSWEDGNLFLG